MVRRSVVCSAAFACWSLAFAGLTATPRAQEAAPRAAMTCAEMEAFLSSAKILKMRELPVGITVPKRATLDNGKLRHDAAVQTTDVSKAVFETAQSTELNFRDSWKFNVAGYELAKLLGLNMVPPYVERKVEGREASLSWFVNDTMMGRERHQKKIEPPNPRTWNEEIYALRVFHQLIYDTDPNLTNMLIAKNDWRIWMIDFTRAFRWINKLQNPKELVKIDRRLLARLRELSNDTLTQKLGRWLTPQELDALGKRRELMIRHFDEQIAKKGEAAVLYDLPRTEETCGTGLLPGS